MFVNEKSPARGPGRPRCEVARARILDSAARLLEEIGFANVTIDAIAEHAGASRATVYRWWPNKAAVLMESFREAVSSQLPFPDTGSLAGDIRAQLVKFAAMLRGRRGRVITGFIAGALADPEVAEAFRQMWIAPRRADAKRALERHRQSGELNPDIDLDIVIDLLYAPIYYRLLTGYGPISKEYVESLADAALKGLEKS